MADHKESLTLLTTFLIIFTIASAETYHISTDSAPCENMTSSNRNANCITLSQFALNSTSYMTSDTISITLTMDPGIHSLDATIFISNVSSFELLGPPGDSTTITCNVTSASAALVFEGIPFARVENVTFKGCGGTRVTSVEQLVIENCNFSADGYEDVGMTMSGTNAQIMRSEFTMYSGGALSVVNNSELLVFDCTFHQNQAEMGDGALEDVLNNNGETDSVENDPSIYNLILTSEQYSDITGGAICVHNSTMILSDTTLTNNAALFGGALFVESSNITITHGTLAGNLAFSGGAIFAVRSNVVITYGNLSNNGALYYRGSGGAVSLGSSTISIENTDFHSNTATYGGSLYVHSSTDLTVVGATFSDNIANSGAAIAVTAQSSATIENSALLSNDASLFGGAIFVSLQSTVTVENSTLSNNTAAYGGAVYSESFSNITIRRCSLLDNRADGGAAIYLNYTYFQCIDSEISQNMFGGRLGYGFAFESEVLIVGKNTISNNCGSFLAVLSNATIGGDTVFAHNNVHNICAIHYFNEILHGGAFSSFLSNIFLIGKVNFSFNVAEYGGAILTWESKLHIWGQVTFANNWAVQGGGGIYIYETMLEFQQARCHFDGNEADFNGGGIDVVSSIINIFDDSDILFTENLAWRGGAMFLELGSKMSIVKTNPFNKINVTFSQNRAYYGGAMYVTDHTNSGTCAASSTELTLKNLFAASECFFQTLAIYQRTYVPEVLIKHLYFSNNSAIISGHSLYGGLLDRCIPSIYAEFALLFLNERVTGTSYIFNTTNIQNEDIASDPVRLCFCENDKPSCDYVPTEPWVIAKGVTTILPVVAVDQLNHTVEAYIVSYLSQNDSRLGFGQSDQKTYGSCSELTFNILSMSDTEELTLFAKGPCLSIGISNMIIDIQFVDCICPTGFRVVNGSEVCRCECGDELLEHLGGEDTCVIDDDNSIIRDSKFWIGTIDSVANRNGCLAVYRYCPFNYCYNPSFPFVTLDLNTSTIVHLDIQCNSSRTGVLCGKCQDGFSLAFGTSRCMPNSQCTNSYLALLIVFALAGIALVAFIMLCNLTVAVGTINGLIFYANIIITNRTNVSQFISVNPVTIFIAWLNLDLGIETCLYQGMNGLAKVGWQFAFPLYVLMLVALVIFLCEHSQRFANFLSGKNPVATLATLILLSYVKFLRIIVDVFSPAKLKYICPNGSKYEEFRWYYDGNVYYFDAQLIVLFLAAMAVLILGIAYTLILLTGQWFTRMPNRYGLKWLSGHKLNHFLEPYFAPYIPKHRYWTGLLLVARLLACIISTFATNSGLPQGNLFGITMIGAFLLLWKLVVGGRIYRYMLLDVLESLFLVFMIVYGDGTQFSLAYVDTLKPIALYYTLGSFALVIFVLILFYHGYTYVLLNTSIGIKFHEWILLKIEENGESFRNASCWKRFSTELEKREKAFTRGQSLFSQPATLDRNRKSQLKKKSQPVTYAMINVVQETPLSEQLGHYKTKRKEREKRRSNKAHDQRVSVLGHLEESDESSAHNDESVSERNAMEHTIEVDDNNRRLVYVCVDLEQRSSDVLRNCGPKLEGRDTITGEDDKLEEEIVKRESLENTPVQPCGEIEHEEFATSYTLISKDN